MKIYHELQELIGRFRKEDVEYALCGGLAMAVHGWPRATMDIDLLIEDASLERSRRIARELGFKHELGEIVLGRKAVRIHRMVKFADKEALPLDFLVVTPTLKAVWDTRETSESRNGPICVVSLKGLARMKKLRGSAQDLADIQKLKGKA
jgi:hypothetical protein